MGVFDHGGDVIVPSDDLGESLIVESVNSRPSSFENASAVRRKEDARILREITSALSFTSTSRRRSRSPWRSR